MLGFLKKIKCHHKFQYVSTEMVPDVDGVVYSYIEKVHIYCPECRKKKTVSSWEWNNIANRQIIDEEYKKSKEGE